MNQFKGKYLYCCWIKDLENNKEAGRLREPQSQSFCLCFVSMTNVCLAFTQPNHNRKKQPSCQTIRFWHVKTNLINHKKGISFTYRVVLHLRGLISDHLSTSSVRTHHYQSERCEEGRMIGSSARRGEGVPAAWRQTLLSSSVTHPFSCESYMCTVLESDILPKLLITSENS